MLWALGFSKSLGQTGPRGFTVPGSANGGPFTLKKALAQKGIGNPGRTAVKTALWPHHRGSPECVCVLRREQMDGRRGLGVLTACLHLSSQEEFRDPRGTCSTQTLSTGEVGNSEPRHFAGDVHGAQKRTATIGRIPPLCQTLYKNSLTIPV